MSEDAEYFISLVQESRTYAPYFINADSIAEVVCW